MLPLLLGLAFAEPQPNVTEARVKVDSTTDAIHDALKQRGYLRMVRLGPRTHYVPLTLWKPRVMVHREGFARIRGTPIYPLSPVPTGTGAEVTFITQNPATIRNQEADVGDVLLPLLADLQQANYRLYQAYERLDATSSSP